MAEFAFFGTWEDSREFLKALVVLNRFTFVVDQWYQSPPPASLVELSSEVETVLEKQRSIYLWSTQYSSLSVQFSNPTPRKLVMIDESRSQAIRLLLPACFERNDRLSLGRGNLGYLSLYQDHNTGTWHRPPETLISDYQEVRTLLRRKMVKRFIRREIGSERGFKSVIETLWVGHYAVSLLDSGKADILTGAEWMWIRAADVTRSRDTLG